MPSDYAGKKDECFNEASGSRVNTPPFEGTPEPEVHFSIDIAMPGDPMHLSDGNTNDVSPDSNIMLETRDTGNATGVRVAPVE